MADTGVVLAKGRGAINLETERMDFRIEGDSKKPRLVRLFIPITIKGPFMAPKIGLDPSKAVGQGGIAAAWARSSTRWPPCPSSPREAKDADCAGLVSEARQSGAPVKVAQTTPAKPKK
ncbi:hypothetical protein ACRAWD_13290 [Caulobacter segnis]